MASAFVDDGFTLRDKVQSPTGLFDPFEIEYRRALPSAVRQHSEKTMGLPADRSHRADCEYLAGYLSSWTLQDGKGKDVLLSPANLARLALPALHEIANLINGWTPHQEAEDAKNSSGA